MHKLVTQADAKAAAEQGLKRAIEESIRHHKDPSRMTRGQLIDAIEAREFDLSCYYCALCHFHNNGDKDTWTTKNCEKCGLYSPDITCCRSWRKSQDMLDDFRREPSETSWKAFLAAEAKMVERLKVELGKVEAEEKKTYCHTCKHQPLKGHKNHCCDCLNNTKSSGWEPKEKKVELRHGDYGMLGGREYFVNFNHPQHISPFGISDSGGQMDFDRFAGEFVKHGNVFDLLDDLAAQSEPLTHFNLKCSGCTNKDTFIAQAEGCDEFGLRIYPGMEGERWCHCTREELEEIGHNLIRMARTAKNKSSKKGQEDDS